MRFLLVAAAAPLMLAGIPAGAQTITAEFRGLRAEGNIGWDRFKSEGSRNDKLGYGATVGFDGVLMNRIVVGPEASYWRANNWTQNCFTPDVGGSFCHRSFEEFGAAVRLGYLLTPDFLVFGKGGYVSNEQRSRFSAGPGNYVVNGQVVGPDGASYYTHGRTDGYQVGGGVEYTLTSFNLPLPVYVSGQYVYSRYSDHTARQRAMLGIGVRFK